MFYENKDYDVLLVPNKNYRKINIDILFRKLSVDYFSVKRAYNFKDDYIEKLIKDIFNEENFIFYPEKIKMYIRKSTFDFLIKNLQTKINPEFDITVLFDFLSKKGFDLFQLNYNDFKKKLLILCLIYIFIENENYISDSSLKDILYRIGKYNYLKKWKHENVNIYLGNFYNFINNSTVYDIKNKIKKCEHMSSNIEKVIWYMDYILYKKIGIEYFERPMEYNEYLSKEFFEHLPPFIEYDLIDRQGRYFLDLSFGEKLLNILFFKILVIISEIKKPTINIIYDEFDVGMHPDMQRRFIDFIIKISKFIKEKNAKQINWIIATHSPFILSDIPKENITFLNRGKEVNDYSDDKNTFGANIYDIFKQGFFLDNSIGTYSENYIKELSNSIYLFKALQYVEENNDYFLLRNFLNSYYEIDKNENISIEDEKRKLDIELRIKILNELKTKKLVLLEDKFPKEAIDKYFIIFNNKLMLKNDISNYINVIGEPTIKTHLSEIYDDIKELSINAN